MVGTDAETEVRFTGPCLLPDTRIVCRFQFDDVQGAVIDRNRGACQMPAMGQEGVVNFSVSLDGGPFYWNGELLVQN